jgi:hypothetical protein
MLADMIRTFGGEGSIEPEHCWCAVRALRELASRREADRTVAEAKTARARRRAPR